MPARSVPAALRSRARSMHFRNDDATRIEDSGIPPDIRLKRLAKECGGLYSLRVSQRWQICFTWARRRRTGGRTERSVRRRKP